MAVYDITGENDFERLESFNSTFNLMSVGDKIKVCFDTDYQLGKIRRKVLSVNNKAYNTGFYKEGGKFVFEAKRVK